MQNVTKFPRPITLSAQTARVRRRLDSRPQSFFYRYLATSSSAALSSSAPSVDAAEVHKFGALSDEWANEGGSFKPLHALNQLRVPWITDNVRTKPSSATVCDVGCGGGLLSIPLARVGFTVTGLDASAEAITSAKRSLQSRSVVQACLAKRLQFDNTTAEEFASSHENGFDAVVASEILEHVANVDSFVEACVRLARPGAPIFFTTINKTMASRLAAIWLAEEVMQIVPKGVHEWEKFVSPERLCNILEENGCSVRSVQGIAYNPFVNEWRWSSCTAVNYALYATKDVKHK